MPPFYFPGTAALLLRTHTWMSDIAIANALRNYGARKEPWWILTRRPDHRSYKFMPAAGGWFVSLTSLGDARELANVEPPF